MTIEITKPETLIERHLRSGRFHDIDELAQESARLARRTSPGAVRGAKRQPGRTQEPV